MPKSPTKPTEFVFYWLTTPELEACPEVSLVKQCDCIRKLVSWLPLHVKCKSLLGLGQNFEPPSPSLYWDFVRLNLSRSYSCCHFYVSFYAHQEDPVSLKSFVTSGWLLPFFLPLFHIDPHALKVEDCYRFSFYSNSNIPLGVSLLICSFRRVVAFSPLYIPQLDSGSKTH